MSTVLVVVIVVVVVALVAGAGFLIWSRARTQRLRRQFGPEYDRAIDSHPNRREAERELHEREQRHQELDIRPLEPRARELYLEQWTHVQEHFVDAPEGAVEQGDRLVITVMGERGYPVQDFDERVAQLSVEHGRMLDHYRRGHEISDKAGRKEASTEELRQAMVHYRALFEDLLSSPGKDQETSPPDDRPEASSPPVDQVRQSRIDTEQAQQEQIQRERAHREQTQAEQAQADQARAEQAQVEEVQAEQAQAEEVQAEQARREQAQPKQARRKRTRVAEVQADQAQVEEAQREQAQVEEAQDREVGAETGPANPRERDPRSGSN
jgi:hypothetical protein